MSGIELGLPAPGSGQGDSARMIRICPSSTPGSNSSCPSPPTSSVSRRNSRPSTRCATRSPRL